MKFSLLDSAIVLTRINTCKLCGFGHASVARVGFLFERPTGLNLTDFAVCCINLETDTQQSMCTAPVVLDQLHL